MLLMVMMTARMMMITMVVMILFLDNFKERTGSGHCTLADHYLWAEHC